MKSTYTSYFHGSFGRWPETVKDSYVEFITQEYDYGAASKQNLRSLVEGTYKARKNLSILTNCNKNNIFFTNNATDAADNIFSVLYRKGKLKKILTTNHEFDSIYYLLSKYSEFNHNINNVNTIFDILYIDENRKNINKKHILDIFKSKIDSDTDLVFFSHVLWTVGFILPAADIVSAIRQINPECIIVIDGAHALGHINIDINKINADYYFSSGHKWLLGPSASGILFMNHNTCKKSGLSVSDHVWKDAFCVPNRYRKILLLPPHLSTEITLGSINGGSRYGLFAATKFMIDNNIDFQGEILEKSKIIRGLLTNYSDKFNFISDTDSTLLSGIINFDHLKLTEHINKNLSEEIRHKKTDIIFRKLKSILTNNSIDVDISINDVFCWFEEKSLNGLRRTAPRISFRICSQIFSDPRSAIHTIENLDIALSRFLSEHPE